MDGRWGETKEGEGEVKEGGWTWIGYLDPKE